MDLLNSRSVLRIKLEPIPPIEMTIKLTNYDLHQVIDSLEKNALDERITGNNDDARRIAKIIMKIEKQME
jgi:hypothetical protein